MNERIKELAEQAGFHIAPYDGINDNDMVKKFAELLIRECAEHAEKYIDDSRIYDYILYQFGFE